MVIHQMTVIYIIFLHFLSLTMSDSHFRNLIFGLAPELILLWIYAMERETFSSYSLISHPFPNWKRANSAICLHGFVSIKIKFSSSQWNSLSSSLQFHKKNKNLHQIAIKLRWIVWESFRECSWMLACNEWRQIRLKTF